MHLERFLLTSMSPTPHAHFVAAMLGKPAKGFLKLDLQPGRN